MAAPFLSPEVPTLNDPEAIRRLIALYPQLLDAKRLDEWGGLFAEDALLDVFGRRLVGRAAIVREAGAMQPAAPDRARAGTRAGTFLNQLNFWSVRLPVAHHR